MQKQLHRIFKFGSGSVSSIHSSNKRKRWRKCCGALSCYWSPSAAVGVVKHTAQKQQASQANMQRDYPYMPTHVCTNNYNSMCPPTIHVRPFIHRLSRRRQRHGHTICRTFTCTLRLVASLTAA
ncbi:unnamed protein product [Ceratitis capitata]|uniref:(Mediterranean fruit fly) hypothetical protein n=1 Tax=Ceratitis capitata TaxID=7213 RepID=A0A811UH38_CERCA|nr:unnamed protein product [Ceratitis capitata]